MMGPSLKAVMRGMAGWGEKRGGVGIKGNPGELMAEEQEEAEDSMDRGTKDGQKDGGGGVWHGGGGVLHAWQ
jgi:hypothetical protein